MTNLPTKATQMEGLYSISAETTIAAPIQEIFDLLASPSRHASFDGSSSVVSMVEGPERLSLGAKFVMSMKIGVPYRIRNEVVEFDAPRLIAWRHYGHHVWRYRLVAIDAATTLVRETFDWRSARGRGLYEVLGYPTKNGVAIVESLARLKSCVESGDR